LGQYENKRILVLTL